MAPPIASLHPRLRTAVDAALARPGADLRAFEAARAARLRRPVLGPGLVLLGLFIVAVVAALHGDLGFLLVAAVTGPTLVLLVVARRRLRGLLPEDVAALSPGLPLSPIPRAYLDVWVRRRVAPVPLDPDGSLERALYALVDEDAALAARIRTGDDPATGAAEIRRQRDTFRAQCDVARGPDEYASLAELVETWSERLTVAGGGDSSAGRADRRRGALESAATRARNALLAVERHPSDPEAATDLVRARAALAAARKA